jgi:hypothetical protein
MKSEADVRTALSSLQALQGEAQNTKTQAATNAAVRFALWVLEEDPRTKMLADAKKALAERDKLVADLAQAKHVCAEQIKRADDFQAKYAAKCEELSAERRGK